jgi:sulfatase maturation enzyme AslB (radical SAM superfamily)
MRETNGLKIPKENRLKDFFLFQKDEFGILWDKLTLNIYSLDQKHIEIYKQLLKIEDEKEIENFVIKKISEFPQLKSEFNELFQESSFKDESKNLRRLNLLISQRCPLGCLYCYAQKGTYGNSSFMAKQMVKKSLESFFSVFDSVEMVQFFGGEPLLNIDLIEYTINLFEELFHKKIIQRKPNFLVESGLGISKENLEEFIELLKVHPEIKVTVSCDGPAEIHNYLRPYANGNPSYNKVIENLNILKGYGQPHAIEVTYTKIHYDVGILPSDLIKYFKNELGLKDSLIFEKPLQIDIDSLLTTNQEQKTYTNKDITFKEHPFYSARKILVKRFIKDLNKAYLQEFIEKYIKVDSKRKDMIERYIMNYGRYDEIKNIPKELRPKVPKEINVFVKKYTLKRRPSATSFYVFEEKEREEVVEMLKMFE